jgi:2'-5' RNA ligase
MDLSGAVMSGYRVYEYMIVLNPQEELQNRVVGIINDFNKEFNPTVRLGGKPNLLLAQFFGYEMREERIINRLKTIALSYPPFKVELKDFGSFPTHTIFINVTSKVSMQNLIKLIRSESQRLMTINDETKPYFPSEAHITIARKLKPWQYEKGWLEYSNKHFTGRFIANSMLLLKRQMGESRWQVAEQLEFKNMPIVTKQGDLFG